MLPPEEIALLKEITSGGTRGHLLYGDVADTVSEEAAIAGLTALLRTARSPLVRTVYLPEDPSRHVAVIFDGPDGADNARRIANALNVMDAVIEEIEMQHRVFAAADVLMTVSHTPPIDLMKYNQARSDLLAALNAVKKRRDTNDPLR